MKTKITKISLWLVILLISVLCGTCITEFIPEINDEKELLVVEGMITDQEEMHTVRISRSVPLGSKSKAKPVTGCVVTVTDDLDNQARFIETDSGTYVSPPGFRGETARIYKLYITITDETGTRNYVSKPAEMLPVAPIVNLYYEKRILRDVDFDLFDIEECQIYLDTYSGINSYFRWEYFETWILRLLFSVPNQKCWVSDRSRNIMIKSTTALEEHAIARQPVVYISTSTDRLKVKYSILVNQYSMNEEEFNFWSALQSLTEESGGPYDIIPAAIPGNITCIEYPDETVLGYFSVSGKSSKRIFIDEGFNGIKDPYRNCITDTIYGNVYIPGLDTSRWVLFDVPQSFPRPRMRVLTNNHGCYDCTDRGTIERPSFWEGN